MSYQYRLTALVSTDEPLTPGAPPLRGEIFASLREIFGVDVLTVHRVEIVDAPPVDGGES